MKKQINDIIKKHKDSDYGIYTLDLSVSDFKVLQRLMKNDYGILDSWTDVMWKHNGIRSNPTRIGTVKFKNMELNVTSSTNYTDIPAFKQVESVDSKFWNSKYAREKVINPETDLLGLKLFKMK